MAPMFREIDQDFFKKWTPTMAYILGYFAADGTMLANKRGGHYIEFHSTDKCLIEMTRSALKSGHRIGVRIPNKKRKNHKISYRIQIGSKEMFADLEALGFVQNKSNVLAFPEVPPKYLADFVRGYFDGDGCVYFKRHKFADRKKLRWILMTTFCSGSRLFLEELHRLLKRFEIQGGSLKNKTYGAYDLAFSFRDSLALYRLMYNTGSVTGLYLPRKYKLFQRAIRTMYPKMRP